MNLPFLFVPQKSLTHYLDHKKKVFGLLEHSVAMVLQLMRFLAMTRQHFELHRLLLENEVAMSPAKISPFTTSDSNFDSNMVIILAALLCALIFALGLNSIVRCALRCGAQRFSFETPDQNVARLASSGLKKEDLVQIPVAVYKSGDIPATECPICLGEFVEEEKVRVLPKCNHGFHVKCIDKWLVSHSSCPTCRQLLFTEEV